MKEGWTYKKLGEICRIERGGSPRPIKAFITNDTNGLNWIKIGDTDPQGKYIYSTKEKIRPEGLKKSRWVEENEFLLSNSMSFGRPYVLKTNGCIHDGWLVLRDYQESLNTDFFYYLLISPTVQRQFKTKAQGSTVSNLNTDRVAGVNVLFPTIEKQLSIVARLDAAFAHIDALKANAEKQLAEARQLFQAELAECMRPKEGWEEKALGEVSVFSQGIQVDVNLQTEICSPGKVRFLRIIDVTQGNVPPRYIDDPGEKYYLKADEIAMVRYGTVGFVCYGFEGVIANNLFKISIKDKSKLQSNYLQYFLKSDLFQSNIRKGVGGAALPAIKFGDIKYIMLGFPPLSEQQRIVSRLDALSANIKKLEEVQRKTLAECDALKQAMLREVFE